MPIRTLLLAALSALLLAAAPSATAAPDAAAAKAPDAKALLRVASKLSALSVRRGVRVVVDTPARFRLRRVATIDRLMPRPSHLHDEAVLRGLGLTSGRNVLRAAFVAKATRSAVYDPRTRRVHVREPAAARTALLEELVHALQDQHFDLRRMRALAGDRDAALAAAAAVEGHARLVAGMLGRRSLAAHGGPRLDAFVDLQRGFVTTVGRRFAVELRNLGGNRAVWSSLRRFPETTEQVFHLHKFLERERPLPIVLPVDAAGLQLVSDATFGELDVRALLAVFRVPLLDRAATGWGGGRSAVYRAGGREAVAVALEWDTELDATQWAHAAAAYVRAAFTGAAQEACPATACWTAAGHALAFAHEGARTVLVVGADAAEAAAVARALVPALST